MYMAISDTSVTKKNEVTIRDDPTLLDDSGEVPNPNGVVDGSIPSCEIIFLLDGKLAKWSGTSCVQKKKKKIKKLQVSFDCYFKGQVP